MTRTRTGYREARCTQLSVRCTSGRPGSKRPKTSASGAPFNRSLDPKLTDASGAHRNFGLKKADIEALVLFLEALNGVVDPFLLINPN